MVGSALLSYAINTVSQVWNMEPHRNIRISSFKTDQPPEPVDGLWTDKGLRPTANNLAFTVKYVQDAAEKRKWAERLQELPIRGGLLVCGDLYHLQYYNQFNELKRQEIEPDELASVLTSPKAKLFTPKALAEFRKGQLSLADLETSISEGNFSFILRQRKKLNLALQSGIETALRQISLSKRSSLRPEMEGHVIRVAIAFLAARILEDKGFFFDSPIPTNNPRELLKRTVSRLNGFFKRAQQQSIPRLEEFLPNDTDRVLQALAANFGNCVTFALVDHRDVGILYERAIKELPKKLTGQEWTDLQRHYTPVAIAERMLELLPLERIRPEERIIFDPAAGSGSLLLAATSRLAGMSDIPEEIDARNTYLANHIAGNDLDEYANLVTQLRYVLARESLGESVAFSFPKYFSHKDYEKLNKDNLGIKPRVIVANPPFSEDGERNIQRAVRFVNRALTWLDEGSQFAFVLPQSFLTNTTHGVPTARRLLTENCQIFEVWQLPQRTVGIEAEQAVCIVLGSVGKSQQIFSSVARAVFSGANNSDIRDNGFLGATWMAQLKSSDKIWKEVTAPSINISVPTVPLGNLFYQKC